MQNISSAQLSIRPLAELTTLNVLKETLLKKSKWRHRRLIAFLYKMREVTMAVAQLSNDDD